MIFFLIIFNPYFNNKVSLKAWDTNISDIIKKGNWMDYWNKKSICNDYNTNLKLLSIFDYLYMVLILVLFYLEAPVDEELKKLKSKIIYFWINYKIYLSNYFNNIHYIMK